MIVSGLTVGLIGVNIGRLHAGVTFASLPLPFGLEVQDVVSGRGLRQPRPSTEREAVVGRVFRYRAWLAAKRCGEIGDRDAVTVDAPPLALCSRVEGRRVRALLRRKGARDGFHGWR